MAERRLVTDKHYVSYTFGHLFPREDRKLADGHCILNVHDHEGHRKEGDGQEFSSQEEAVEFAFSKGYLQEYQPPERNG